MTRRWPAAPGWIAGAIALDAAIVVAFAGVGRRSHDESSGVSGVLGTAAPFLCALAVVWLVAIVVPRRGGQSAAQRAVRLRSVDGGVVMALATVALGMLGRRFLWDRGTALAFVIVTAAFLTCFMGGWRAVWSKLRARSNAAA